MTIKAWFEQRKKEQEQRKALEAKVESNISSDLWVRCVHCNAQLPKADLINNQMVCPICDYHFRINARTRIKQLFDENSFEEMFKEIKSTDPLEFIDTVPYKDRLKSAQTKTNLDDAIITGIGKINGYRFATAVMDFEFMGGSMGSTVGEKVTRIMETAIKERIPMLAITSSGGARMQESVLSLMQMAKTSCACAKMDQEKILYICLLTEPTFGGVTASFGTLGDIIIAEQGARIGFAGRRVIEQTIKQKLPSDFQTAEYLLKYGQVDFISKRKDLRDNLTRIVKMYS
jgi:acetyl-CoA carboxylase carboxyl transferase subunit beta